MSTESRYVTALQRWNESAYGPYGDDLPEYRPSVVRDLKFAASDLASLLWERGWPERLSTVVMLWLGLLTVGAFKLAYWAQWEKCAWYWSRTDAQEQLRQTGTARPPRFHRALAFTVGLFWGALGLLVTMLLWALVAWLARIT